MVEVGLIGSPVPAYPYWDGFRKTRTEWQAARFYANLTVQLFFLLIGKGQKNSIKKEEYSGSIQRSLRKAKKRNKNTSPS